MILPYTLYTQDDTTLHTLYTQDDTTLHTLHTR